MLVLVSDGDPTDQDPAAVEAQAAAIAGKGVKIISVLYSSESTATRSNNLVSMQNINNEYVKDGVTWYASD